jgi:hypothetical protein
MPRVLCGVFDIGISILECSSAEAADPAGEPDAAAE